MQVFGNFHHYKLSFGNNVATAYDLDDIVSTEKLIKITATQDVHILLTPVSDNTDADGDDYLIPANEEREFLVGRGLDRIAVFNDSGNVIEVYIAILY